MQKHGLCVCFRQITKVEGNSDHVTLSEIIAFIIVIVNNEVVAVLLRTCNILEVVSVKWVRQHVVGVDTFDNLANGWGHAY